MNATPFSPPDPLQDNNLESDTETNPDDTTEYYQPLSALYHDDSHSDQSNSDEEHHNSPHFSDYRRHHHLDNGHCARQAEDGISTLTLNGDVEGKGSSSDDDDEEELEEERVGEASDTAILRAFREEESRRNAPLTPENARRVMEAMRGVSFGSFVPDWAGGVRGEQWIDELRRLRQPPGDGNQPSFRN
ncbi:hypothetical protein SADUNF_Sadunf09G0062100 [Salix dunnii]|uniref:Uncharacterized protein n=1 Tax=Salix dunnii TaxID=1413687 RepID=A0A835JVP1_9ROSI|nr:hypothetical protein SADUNF_Sadunf09G0062100 [Salix dunnii]